MSSPQISVLIVATGLYKRAFVVHYLGNAVIQNINLCTYGFGAPKISLLAIFST